MTTIDTLHPEGGVPAITARFFLSVQGDLPPQDPFHTELAARVTVSIDAAQAPYQEEEEAW
jgi:hypothetical protein